MATLNLRLSPAMQSFSAPVAAVRTSPGAVTTKPGATANVQAPAALHLLGMKQAISAPAANYVQIYTKTQDPSYTPTTNDLIQANSAGVDLSQAKWNVSVDPALSAAIDAGVDVTAQNPMPGEIDEGQMPSGGFDPNSVLAEYGDIAAYAHDTGHAVSKAEVRTFYVSYYLKLGSQIGL